MHTRSKVCWPPTLLTVELSGSALDLRRSRPRRAARRFSREQATGWRRFAFGPPGIGRVRSAEAGVQGGRPGAGPFPGVCASARRPRGGFPSRPEPRGGGWAPRPGFLLLLHHWLMQTSSWIGLFVLMHTSNNY